MIKKQFLVRNRLGIHARPSGQIVGITNRAKCEIFIHFNGVTANAKSILNIMMLAVESGKTIEFEAIGEDEVDVIQQLEELFESKFYEED